MSQLTKSMIELNNGCICCSLNNDLADAVIRLLNHNAPLDHLVVECTGLADPLPIVLTFMRPELRDRVRVDSIVAIADAVNFSVDRFSSKAAENQLRYADIILLNKCDLVQVERLLAIEGKVRTIKRNARIVRTTYCRVALPLILGVDQCQSNRHLGDADDRHADCDRDHLVDDEFETFSIKIDRPLVAEKFQHFLECLAPNVFRGKGILWIDGVEKPYIFHLVGERFTLDECPTVGSAESRLVLIGQKLDLDWLRHQLQACTTY